MGMVWACRVLLDVGDGLVNLESFCDRCHLQRPAFPEAKKIKVTPSLFDRSVRCGNGIKRSMLYGDGLDLESLRSLQP